MKRIIYLFRIYLTIQILRIVLKVIPEGDIAETERSILIECIFEYALQIKKSIK